MKLKMPKIKECSAEECAYNRDWQCHALAITVGDGGCPLCDTALKSSQKGGVPSVIGSVGACKASMCQFNKELECGADGISVKMHSDHPECATFKAR